MAAGLVRCIGGLKSGVQTGGRRIHSFAEAAGVGGGGGALQLLRPMRTLSARRRCDTDTAGLQKAGLWQNIEETNQITH